MAPLEPRTSARRFLTRYNRDLEGEVPPRSQLTPMLSRTTIALDALKAQWRRGLSLNIHERQAMAHLWESGRMSMSELGEKLALSRAAMTALVDRLEQLGYVERTVDELDRRRTLIRMTERPYVRLTPLAMPYHEALSELAESFDDREWEAVVKLLDVVYDISQEQTQALSPRSDEELRAMCDKAEIEHERGGGTAPVSR